MSQTLRERMAQGRQQQHQQQQQQPSGSSSSLSTLLRQARASGSLKLVDRQLRELPADVPRIAELVEPDEQRSPARFQQHKSTEFGRIPFPQFPKFQTFFKKVSKIPKAPKFPIFWFPNQAHY